MKTFLKYIGIALGMVLLIMCVLDLIYTTVYYNGAHRSKIMWVNDLESNYNADFLILGSSRANYSIKPKKIFAETGKSGLNLGMNSSSIIETQLLLEKFLEKGTVKAVYVQVDSFYDQDFPDPVGEVAWMPFIHDGQVFEKFEPHGLRYSAYRYIPFYRYQKFGGRLGIREVLSSLFGTGYDYPSTNGYMPRYGVLQEEKRFIPDKPIVSENQLYTDLINFCNERNIKIYFFTAPYYKFKGDIEKLEEFLPNYTNFSDSLKNRDYFSDQTHLNTKGAEVFTKIFTDSYFVTNK